MTFSSDAIVKSLQASINSSQNTTTPYSYWYLQRCLPDDVAKEILSLPFAAPSLDGISGKRELHNATRTYFDAENMKRHQVCQAFNEAFQSKATTDFVASYFKTNLEGCYLRVEFATDINGFWLEPHSDLGVKTFTMLLYMSTDESHHDLGTDVYDADKQHIGRSPFESNAAMVFVPADNTFHGFEPRDIKGVRKSIIINYVTDEWRAREQLAYPDQPIAA